MPESAKRPSRRTAPSLYLAAALLLFSRACLAAGPSCTGEDGELLAAPIAEDFRTVAAQERRFVPAGIAPPSLLDPEAQDLDDMALEAISAFLARAEIRLTLLSEKADRYGRRPALFFAQGRLLQEELLERGLAVALPVDLGGRQESCARLFLAAEDRARRAARGLWARPQIVLNAHAPDALSSQYGRYVVVAGTIISVGNRPTRTYLDFGRIWSRDFTAEIAAERRDAFGGEAGIERLAGRKVRLRGFLAERSGPMLELAAPWQLEIVPGD
ncbi:thermonuclease family protein [Afifella sp. IM 167]|uniref:thermonuclease family protein n=1 Tax=Afifella sp. IM 167 TaxID=2033586 RepID=UPI001CCEE53F|nr:thermonuclease family protein [Afifella sp. IM 167]